MDRRATEQVQWLRDNIGENRLFEVSCNRLEDHPTLVNLMGKAESPRIFRADIQSADHRRVHPIKADWEGDGEFSSGAFFGIAYDLRQNKFDEELLAKIGLDPKIMPDFFSCEELIGSVTEAAAKETGLVPGIPVAAGSVDCNAGWVGGGAVNAGDIQINLGTCVASSASSTKTRS